MDGVAGLNRARHSSIHSGAPTQTRSSTAFGTVFEDERGELCIDVDALLTEGSFSFCSAELRDPPPERNMDEGSDEDAADDAMNRGSPAARCRTLTPSPSPRSESDDVIQHRHPHPLSSTNPTRQCTSNVSPSEPFHTAEPHHESSSASQFPPDSFHPLSTSFASTAEGPGPLGAPTSTSSFATTGMENTGRTVAQTDPSATHSMLIFGLSSFAAGGEQGQPPLNDATAFAQRQSGENSFFLNRDDSQEEVYGGTKPKPAQLGGQYARTGTYRDEDAEYNYEEGPWLVEERSRELLAEPITSDLLSQTSSSRRNTGESPSFLPPTHMTNNNNSLDGLAAMGGAASLEHSTWNSNIFPRTNEPVELENIEQRRHYSGAADQVTSATSKNLGIATPPALVKIQTPLERILAKLEWRYWNQNFEHQPAGEIHISEILCSIFLYLPAHRPTLLRASEVSRAWCERIERLPQWRFVPVIRQNQLLQRRQAVALVAQQRRPARRTDGRVADVTIAVGGGTEQSDSDLSFPTRPPAWWRTAMKKNGYLALEGWSPLTPPTPLPSHSSSAPSPTALLQAPGPIDGRRTTYAEVLSLAEVNSPATTVDFQSYQPVATLLTSKGLRFLTLDPSRSNYIRAMVEQWVEFDREKAEQRRQDRRDQVERCSWSVRVVLLALAFLVTIFTIGWALASSELDLFSSQGQVGGVLFFITFVLTVIVLVLGAYSWHAILKSKTEQLRTSVGTGTVSLFLALLLISFVGSTFFSIYTLRLTALENIIDTPILDMAQCANRTSGGSGGGGGATTRAGAWGDAPYLVRFPPKSAHHWALNLTHPWIGYDSGLSFLSLTAVSPSGPASRSKYNHQQTDSTSPPPHLPPTTKDDDPRSRRAGSSDLSSQYLYDCPDQVQLGILDFPSDSGFPSSEQAWAHVLERNVNKGEELIFRTTRFASFYAYPKDIGSRSGWSEAATPVGWGSSHVVIIGTIPLNLPDDLPDSAFNSLVLARTALVGICCGLFSYTVTAFCLGMALYHKSKRIMVWLMFSVLVLNIVVLLTFGGACFFGDDYHFCTLNKTTAQAIFVFSCIALFIVHVVGFLLVCK